MSRRCRDPQCIRLVSKRTIQRSLHALSTITRSLLRCMAFGDSESCLGSTSLGVELFVSLIRLFSNACLCSGPSMARCWRETLICLAMDTSTGSVGIFSGSPSERLAALLFAVGESGRERSLSFEACERGVDFASGGCVEFHVDREILWPSGGWTWICNLSSSVMEAALSPTALGPFVWWDDDRRWNLDISWGLSIGFEVAVASCMPLSWRVDSAMCLAPSRSRGVSDPSKLDCNGDGSMAGDVLDLMRGDNPWPPPPFREAKCIGDIVEPQIAGTLGDGFPKSNCCIFASPSLMAFNLS